MAVEVGAHALELDAHRLAAEHVLDAQLAHLAHHVAAGLEQLEHGRQGAHRDAAIATGLHHPCAEGAGGRRDGDDDLIGLDLVETYCSLLPVTVIAEILGVPEADREKVLRFGAAAAPSLDLGLSWREFRQVARAGSLLRAVADGTTDAVFVKDRDGRYLLFNEAAARFVG